MYSPGYPTGVREHLCILQHCHVDPNIPSLYVGESSRTIQEHWAAYKGSKKGGEGSCIHKHQKLQHDGGEPNFTLRAVSFHKSALL